jgi:hypothetical protein
LVVQQQQLSGIGISAVWGMLVAACKDIALYYGGAVVTGAVVGGAIGAAAFGVGAAPGMVIGTAAGAQVGTWVLALLGLKELAEGLGSMLPAALDHYERGFREAWGAAPGDRRDTWNSTAPASGNAYSGAWHMAQGHVIMVMAILTALAAYLSRGRGNKALLMQEIRESRRLGPKFADWLIENEGKLRSNPQLQSLRSTSAGIIKGELSPTKGRGAAVPTGAGKSGASGVNSGSSASKISFESSLNEVDRFVGKQAGKTISENPISARSYQRLLDNGTEVRFVNDRFMDDAALFEGHKNAVTINMLKMSSGDDVASALVHEATHQNRWFNGVKLGNQFEEYLAYKNEFLYSALRRPSLTERRALWQQVQHDYAHLPQGRNPFGGD